MKRYGRSTCRRARLASWHTTTRHWMSGYLGKRPHNSCAERKLKKRCLSRIVRWERNAENAVMASRLFIRDGCFDLLRNESSLPQAYLICACEKRREVKVSGCAARIHKAPQNVHLRTRRTASYSMLPRRPGPRAYCSAPCAGQSTLHPGRWERSGCFDLLRK